jgi:predicted deacylase
MVADTPTAELPTTPTSSIQIIGSSVEGRDIEVYTFGTGSTSVLFVGGIHGGYEWNSILLAYQTIDTFTADAAAVPENLTVHIIPNLNPDGLYAATGLAGRFSADDITNYNMHQTGAGRFNANDVDLNRNFDCKWAPTSSWRGRTVSAGTAPFSEPEAVALRDYVLIINPVFVVFWHSQANNVYASECEDGVLMETLALMNTYAAAADYGAVASFDAYPVTGDAEGWLASIGIPAITVELEGRLTTEWERNWAGVQALLARYAE